MFRRQSYSKFKISEFAILTAIFSLYSLNAISIAPALADDESSGNSEKSKSMTTPEAKADSASVTPASPTSPTTAASSPPETSLTPADLTVDAPIPNQMPELAPAQAPTLAPEQAASTISNPAPTPGANDLVMQAPQLAIDPAVASAYSLRLGKMEEIAFGASYAEHELSDRIDHLEEEIFKSKNAGSPDARIAKLEAKVFGQSAFAGGSQAPRGAGYMPFNPASSSAPEKTPIASVNGVSSGVGNGISNGAGSGASIDNGGNMPPVIIPGAPSQQTPSVTGHPQLPPAQLQPAQAPSYPSQMPYQRSGNNGAPPNTTSSYPGTRPNAGNSNYSNSGNGGYGYPAPAPYATGSRPQYPSNYLPPATNPYQYGSGTQTYAGQNYNQYQPYQPYRPNVQQQPLMPQQPYPQTYQQYPQSQYPQSQYPQYPQYPNSQNPNSRYPQPQYLQTPQPQYPTTQLPPVVTPQPDNPTSKNAAACDKVASAISQSAKDTDYFSNIRHFAGGTTMHWQSFPVIVHLPKDCPESWRRALDGDLKKWGQYVPLTIAKGDDKAKIDVQFVNKLPPKILGVARIEGSTEDLKVTIFVLRPTFYPSEIPENVLQNVFAHELGHALGLLGHSTNIADVMYIHDEKQDKVAKSTKTDKPAKSDKTGKAEEVATSATPVKSPYGSDKPSGRDLNTLKKLYMSPPMSPGFKLEQPLEYSFKIQ